MKSSALFRTLELAKMAAQIGLKEARSGNLQSRLEQAKVLAEGLSQMKGAAMKAGQLLSLELVDYFPKEATEILSRLQNSATQLEFNQIDQIIRSELGSQAYAKLKSIEATPIVRPVLVKCTGQRRTEPQSYLRFNTQEFLSR